MASGRGFWLAWGMVGFACGGGAGSEGSETGGPLTTGGETTVTDTTVTGSGDVPTTNGPSNTGGSDTGTSLPLPTTGGETTVDATSDTTADTTDGTTGVPVEGGVWDRYLESNGACGLDVDGAGNVYVLNRSARVDKLDPSGNTVWTQDFACFAGVSLGSQDPCYIDVNAAGEVAIAGLFSEDCTIGDDVMLHDADWMDVYLARLDPAGAPLWARPFGGNDGETQLADGVAIDDAGDVAILLTFDNAVDVGAGVWPATGEPFQSDIAVARYVGATGAYQWGIQWKGEETDEGGVLAVNAAGTLLVSAQVTDAFSFLGDDHSDPSGFSDPRLHLVALGPGGDVVWQRLFDNIDAGIFSGEIADDGRALFGANYDGQIDFGTGLVGNDAGAAFLLFLDPAGVTTKVSQITDVYSYLSDVRFVPGGRVAISGVYGGSMTIGGVALPQIPNDRMFVAVTDESGAHLWSGAYGDDAESFASESVTGLGVDASGRLAITGDFEETIDFGLGLHHSPGSFGTTYVALLDPAL